MHILRANAGRKGSLDELSCVFKKYIESQILLDSKMVKSDKTGYYFFGLIYCIHTYIYIYIYIYTF